MRNRSEEGLNCKKINNPKGTLLPTIKFIAHVVWGEKMLNVNE